MTEFRFYTESSVVRFSGRRANGLRELADGIREVSGSSIFYHMHHSLLRRHFAPADHMNDFARWTWLHLGEQALAERLAVVDPMECISIRETRSRLAGIIKGYIRERRSVRRAARENEFCFLELQSFVHPVNLTARNLREFYECLKGVGPGSVFYHCIDARVRLNMKGSDFSCWLKDQLGESELGAQIDSLSPYVYNLWDLKQEILDLVGRKIGGLRG